MTNVNESSLSRREESSKHKLSECLLACLCVRTSLIDWRSIEEQKG